MHHDDEQGPITMSREELKERATRVAEALKSASGASDKNLAGGGSRQRGLPEELRAGFVDVRAALFQRVIFDPVLVLFDSATAAPASNAELAERLSAVAQIL